MELTNMTNEELKSIIENANKIISDRVTNERRGCANAIFEAIRKFRDGGGSIYIEGTEYCVDEWANDRSILISSDIDSQTVFEINEYGDIIIKNLYFERDE